MPGKDKTVEGAAKQVPKKWGKAAETKSFTSKNQQRMNSGARVKGTRKPRPKRRPLPEDGVAGTCVGVGAEAGVVAIAPASQSIVIKNHGAVRLINDWPARRKAANGKKCAWCNGPLWVFVRCLGPKFIPTHVPGVFIENKSRVLFNGVQHKSVLYVIWILKRCGVPRDVSKRIMYHAFTRSALDHCELKGQQFHAKSCSCAYHLPCYQERLQKSSKCAVHGVKLK
jgi:hypothetical protein